MNVLFLDFDGVLNTPESWRARGPDALDDDKLSRLHQVIQATKCKVVVSSSWRVLHTLAELQAFLMLDDSVVIGVTPKKLDLWGRDEEIQAWLAGHPEVDKFAVVDDESSDLTGVEDRLVKTDTDTGLQEEHIGQLIQLLS